MTPQNAKNPQNICVGSYVRFVETTYRSAWSGGYYCTYDRGGRCVSVDPDNDSIVINHGNSLIYKKLSQVVLEGPYNVLITLEVK